MISFRVIGIPAPQGSKSFMGVGANGRAKMVESSKKVGPWRDAVRTTTHQFMTNAGLAPFECPLFLLVTFYLPRPKSAPKRVIWPAKYPDLSKLVRSTEDGMTDRPPDKKGNKLTGAWADDALIVRCMANKEFATADDPTGAVITVVPVEKADALAAVGMALGVTDLYTDKPKHPEGLPF